LIIVFVIVHSQGAKCAVSRLPSIGVAPKRLSGV
jgi:hypothetical protein